MKSIVFSPQFSGSFLIAAIISFAIVANAQGVAVNITGNQQRQVQEIARPLSFLKRKPSSY